MNRSSTKDEFTDFCTGHTRAHGAAITRIKPLLMVTGWMAIGNTE